MSIIRVLTGLLICISFSCNQKKVVDEKNQFDDQEKDKYQIIALLIEQLPPGPPPPPPPPGVYKKDTISFNRYRDSIFELDVNVAVINELNNYNNQRKYDDLGKEYQILIDKLRLKDINDHKIIIDKIPVKKNRKLIAFDSLDNSRQFLLKHEKDKINYVISFSEIIFNEDQNKAILCSSSYSHPLNGSTELYLLKKENGIWQIFKRKTLSIS